MICIRAQEKNCLNFESHLTAKSSDFSSLRDRAFFNKLAYIWTTLSDFQENFITDVLLDKEVPVKVCK